MLNPMAINSIGVYQQLVQQAANTIPTLLPRIQQTAASEAIHHVDEQPVDRDPRQQTELHTLVDYTPWLKHLYQHWQTHLQQSLGKHPHPKPTDDMHWHPASSAKLLNDVALAYTGWLWHQEHKPLPESIEQITLLWRDAWGLFSDELKQSKADHNVIAALNNTANQFHQLWIESCLHLAYLQQTLPYNNNLQ
jgi:hypothetical protein